MDTILVVDEVVTCSSPTYSFEGRFRRVEERLHAVLIPKSIWLYLVTHYRRDGTKNWWRAQHSQRLWLAKVDDVEAIGLARAYPACREEEPLRMPACPVIPAEQQVVLV